MNINIVNKSGFELPKYETNGSAGMDLRCIENIVIEPMERCLVKTGLFISLPEGYEAQIRPRSGLALKKGVTVLNSPGTIDSDYRGEMGVILVNLSKDVVYFEKGDRVAQIVITKHEQANLIEVDGLDETKRGDGGFGHTGVKSNII